MPKNKLKAIDDNFIMSPKSDFVFKYIFGNEKHKDIKKAYDLLQIISKDEKARMLYEAREAEIRDERTRIKSAKAEGATENEIENDALIISWIPYIYKRCRGFLPFQYSNSTCSSDKRFHIFFL